MMSIVSHTAGFTIRQPIEVLFPLFSAEGEKFWVPGWDYENVMDSKELHEDYVFLTKNHDHASTDAIWLVKRYEQESHLVQFYKVEPQDKIGVITVQCTQEGPDRTKVEVTYKYIGLSSKGDRFIEEFTARKYNDFIAKWESLLTRYFNSID